MKKISLLFTFAFFVLYGNAQLSYGPKLGFNFSKVTGTNKDYKVGFKPGFNIGGFANYKFAEHLSGQIETFYSAEGSKSEFLPENHKAIEKANFVNIPILFKYSSSMGLFAETGPQLGLLLTYKSKFEDQDSYIDRKENMNATVISWCIGAGYELKQLPGLSLGLRYAPSITKMDKAAVGGGKLKPQTISLNVLYALPGFKK